MGWTSYHATHYKNGKIDRKAECDAYWVEGLNADHFEIVKSAMVGSVYYAAIKCLKKYMGNDDNGNSMYVDIPEDQRETFGVVFLTATDAKDYFNFAYKDISEDMGPFESKCPIGIINALSPTTNKNALAWRTRCIENAHKKKNDVAIGTMIEFEDYDGNTVRLIKRSPAYQFKTAWFEIVGKHMYFQKKRIPWDRVRIVESANA